jgi:hypothetical protein
MCINKCIYKNKKCRKSIKIDTQSFFDFMTELNRCLWMGLNLVHLKFFHIVRNNYYLLRNK